jgi:hypothetical protein
MKLLDSLLECDKEEECLVNKILSSEKALLAPLLSEVGSELKTRSVPVDMGHWLPVFELLLPILEGEFATENEEILAVLQFLNILFELGYNKRYFLNIEV